MRRRAGEGSSIREMSTLKADEGKDFHKEIKNSQRARNLTNAAKESKRLTRCQDTSKIEFKKTNGKQLSSVQVSSVTQSCLTLCDTMDCSTPGFPVHHQPPELAEAHVPQVSDAIQPSHLLFSPSPLAFNLSQHQGLFQYESVLCIRWPKFRSFSFSINPSNEYSGLISFRIEWFDLLAVQGTLKSLLQHQ